ncbi:hypothetical protein [Nitrosospira multiformis]|uniref:hypothetical protein n=1 Tax=Nitrosospira multiformis TaxID=1231 RepID=UPI000A9A9F3F|nr:hypothetical protein [Nitrosospira multiformis]
MEKTLIVISAKTEIRWFVITLKRSGDHFCGNDDTLMNPGQNHHPGVPAYANGFMRMPDLRNRTGTLSSAAKGKDISQCGKLH